jgi:hypothetical protein
MPWCQTYRSGRSWLEHQICRTGLLATSADHWVAIGAVILALLYSAIVWRIALTRIAHAAARTIEARFIKELHVKGHSELSLSAEVRRTLTPAQEQLLALIAKYQRQFAANKLIIDRTTGALIFDGAPDRARGISLMNDLFDAMDQVAQIRFIDLVESLPAEYLRFLPEMRWDSPFVVSVTDVGLNYLRGIGNEGLHAKGNRDSHIGTHHAERAKNNSSISATVINQEKSAAMEAALANAARIPKLQPDWSIRELFFYLRPQGFNTEAEKEAVGKEVLDKFSAGFLKVWGRKIEDSRRLPLAEIPATEWAHANFGRYWFLDGGDENRQALHAEISSSERGRPPRHYADLQVVRAIAETLWPNDPIPIHSAARLLYEAVEEAGITNSVVGVPYSSPDVALDYFKHVLLKSDAELSGVRPPSSKSRPIPRDERINLEPMSGKSNLRYLMASLGLGYRDVTIRRHALINVAHDYIEKLRRLEARFE